MGVRAAHSNTVALATRLEQLIAKLPAGRKPHEDNAPVMGGQQPPPQDTLPKLPHDQATALVAAYEAGATVYQLAAQFGVHRQTVSRILKRSGVTLRRRTLTADEVAQLIRAHQEGESVERIAAQFHIQPSTVRKRLDKRRRGQ